VRVYIRASTFVELPTGRDFAIQNGRRSLLGRVCVVDWGPRLFSLKYLIAGVIFHNNCKMPMPSLVFKLNKYRTEHYIYFSDSCT